MRAVVAPWLARERARVTQLVEAGDVDELTEP